MNYASDAEAAAAVVGEIAAAGRDAVAIQGDVSRRDDVARLVDALVRRWGRIDAAVANAGISQIKTVDTIEEADWDRMIDVNLKGAFLVAQHAAAVMRRQGSGRIVMVSSQAGQSGGFFVGAHYSASKGGLIALTKALARQLAADGILVNAVAPGIVDTDMSNAFPPSRVDGLVAQVPLKRIGTAEDVAAAVAFLCSPDASYITGATIPVNGGLYMP